MYGFQLLAGLGRQAIHVLPQLVELALHGGHLRLHGEHALHAGQVETALGHQLLDAAQPVHVVERVEPRALGGTPGPDESPPFVHSQSLGMHLGQLGRHRDHEHRPHLVF